MSETLSQMAGEMLEAVKGIISRRLGPIETRVRALEDRKPEKGLDGKDADEKAITARVLADVTKAFDSIPVPQNGKDADPEEMRAAVRAEVDRVAASIPIPKDGKNADPEVVAAMVAAEVARLPRPENGKDADPILVQALVRSEVVEAVSKIRVPEDGKSVDPFVVRSMVEAEVAATVGKIPRPLDGKDFDPAMLKAEVERAVAAIPKPENGKDANPAEIAAEVLERVMRSVRQPQDGKSVTLDEVRPVIEGEMSRWHLEFERRASDLLQKAIDRMPVPKDGLGFDDLEIDEKDDRTIVFVFRNGDRQKRFEYTLPMLIDRGTFKAGEAYERGDCVTYGGSLFTAQRDTLPTERPEDGSGAFRLAVKRGRDGGGS